MALKKEELRLVGDHLRVNARRKYGAQSGGLKACAVKPDLHGFHPVNELCPSCRSAAELSEEGVTEEAGEESEEWRDWRAALERIVLF